MNSKPKITDSWLEPLGPAALVICEHLCPVEGPEGIVFPATYAAAEDKTKFAGGYNIDVIGEGRNVCQIDSVGSQANRIEPMFAKAPYSELIPQIVIRAGEKEINLVDAGHRAGDAIVRCSSLQHELRAAFKAVLNGDAEPLAKIAPTSLVFGVWDSRDTQAKLPRLVASTIRAFDVKELTRSANYLVQQKLDYVKDGLLPEPANKAEKDEYSKRGYQNALASATHGGVIASGGIRREAVLSLAALRMLAAGKDKDKTLALQRYILGLALTALMAPQSSYLRQGCNLVPDATKPREFKIILANGRPNDVDITHEEALAFARIAAKEFGIGESRTVEFDKELAEADVKGSAVGEKNGKTKGRK